MTKAVKEFLLDQGTGEVNVEYSDNTTTSFNLANAVTATQSAQGMASAPPYTSIFSLIGARQDAGLPTHILCLSDSTGSDAQVRFLYRMAVALAAKYPAACIKYRFWDDTAKGWPPTTTLSTGTVGPDIQVHIGAVSGTRIEYMLGDRARTLFSMQPQVILTNHGHNYAVSTWPTTESLVAALSVGVETASALAPEALHVIVGQAPGSTGANTIKALAHRRYAYEIGAAYADAHSKFLAAGNGVELYLDGVHQTAAGDELLLAAVIESFTIPVSSVKSTLLQKSNAINTNPLFTAGSANAVPTGWTGSNITVTDITTQGVWETGARALKLARTADGSPSNMYYALSANELAAVKGQVVTFAVKELVPSTAPSGSGRVKIECRDAGGIIVASSATSAASTEGRDGLRWYSQSVTVPETATIVRLYIYADASNAVAASECTVDRAILTIGDRVRDCF